jgi:hypothetical protein
VGQQLRALIKVVVAQDPGVDPGCGVEPVSSVDDEGRWIVAKELIKYGAGQVVPAGKKEYRRVRVLVALAPGVAHPPNQA